MWQQIEPGETMTYYAKMKGDYYRYKAELAEGAGRDSAAQNAALAYQAGIEQAKSLPGNNAIRLGLALNYSVFQHEVLKETSNARNTANEAFVEAWNAFAKEGFTGPLAWELIREKRIDVATTLDLIQDNL